MFEQQATHESPPSSETAEHLLAAPPASVLDEIREAEFPIARRGYDPDAVDAYIAHVSRLVEDLVATRSPQLAVNRALENLGDETAGILREARESARRMTERAETKVRHQLEELDREVRAQRAEAEADVRRLGEDADRIWGEREQLVEDTRRLAEALLKIADDAHGRFPSKPLASSPAAAVTTDREVEETGEDVVARRWPGAAQPVAS
jgi:DivIVA domain-containing protein